jgi:succinate-semialdehyde dehydrogenase/glutarate-semialdehyde dehydrogenase
MAIRPDPECGVHPFSSADSQLITVDPATGDELARYPTWTGEEVDAAVELAWQRWGSWRATPLEQRITAVAGAADTLDAASDALTEILTAEMGRPTGPARAEIAKCATAIRYLCSIAADRLGPRAVAGADAGESVWLRADPLGPILGIMPWNFPYWQSVRFLVPALLAGNTILLKPAPSTLGSGLALQAAFDAAGLGDGLVTTMPISVEPVAALIADPRVHGVSLTGSVRAGRSVGELAGRHLKKLVLELGGSDPFIVFPDADVEKAATVAANARLQNTGQSCIAAKRFLVHRDVAQRFTDAMTAAFDAAVVGDPRDDGVQYGPLATEAALTTIVDQVERSVAAGAVVATGGHRLDRPGFFFAPTLLTDVPDDAPCWHDEVFGPVAPVRMFDDVDTLVNIVNASEYGLGASAWTSDAAVIETLSEQLEVGQLFVNGMVASDPRYPFGGVKDSGFGRELGEAGFGEFVNLKLVRQFGTSR